MSEAVQAWGFVSSTVKFDSSSCTYPRDLEGCSCEASAFLHLYLYPLQAKVHFDPLQSKFRVEICDLIYKIIPVISFAGLTIHSLNNIQTICFNLDSFSICCCLRWETLDNHLAWLMQLAYNNSCKISVLFGVGCKVINNAGLLE